MTLDTSDQTRIQDYKYKALSKCQMCDLKLCKYINNIILRFRQRVLFGNIPDMSPCADICMSTFTSGNLTLSRYDLTCLDKTKFVLTSL